MLEDLAGDFAIGDEALSSEFPGDLDDASFPDELAEGDEEFLKREDLHSPDPESTPSKEATISMAFQSQETSSVRERRERVRQSRKREKSPFSLILGASALVVGLTLLAIHLA